MIVRYREIADIMKLRERSLLGIEPCRKLRPFIFRGFVRPLAGNAPRRGPAVHAVRRGKKARNLGDSPRLASEAFK